MEWIADPMSAGGWIRDRLNDDWSMHHFVPHGFEAYARIFHPADVRSLPDRPVPMTDEWSQMPDAERQRLTEQLVDAPTSWADAAAAFGSTMHGLAQWQHLVSTPTDGDWHTRIAPDGREFSAPREGEISRDLLATIARRLVKHTSTPDGGYAAIWEGRGGPGILSDAISKGPRFELPDRGHVLFSAAPTDFADSEWILDAPWRDREAEAHGFAPSAQHPSVLWPTDHAWVMVSEIDYDSTIVAGSHELIREICTDPAIEALPVREGSALHWDADDINR